MNECSNFILDIMARQSLEPSAYLGSNRTLAVSVLAVQKLGFPHHGHVRNPVRKHGKAPS